MKFIKRKLKKIKNKILYGHAASSDDCIKYFRKIGMRIGEGTTIFDPRNTLIDETRPWLIEIGKNVQITYGVTMLTHGYDWSVLKGKYGDVLGSAGKIKIGDNVFIGVNTTILKGVSIGSNVIIGAGSLVNKDIPCNSIAVGNPARVICSLDEYYKKRVGAQENEAIELVKEYRKVYNENPGEREMAEFFWLFSGKDDDYNSISKEYVYKMKMVGNEKEAITKWKKNKCKFKNMKDFFDFIE